MPEGNLSHTELYLPLLYRTLFVCMLEGNLSCIELHVFVCMLEGNPSCTELYLPVCLREFSLVFCPYACAKSILERFVYVAYPTCTCTCLAHFMYLHVALHRKASNEVYLRTCDITQQPLPSSPALTSLLPLTTPCPILTGVTRKLAVWTKVTRNTFCNSEISSYFIFIKALLCIWFYCVKV